MAISRQTNHCFHRQETKHCKENKKEFSKLLHFIYLKYQEK